MFTERFMLSGTFGKRMFGFVQEFFDFTIRSSKRMFTEVNMRERERVTLPVVPIACLFTCHIIKTFSKL